MKNLKNLKAILTENQWKRISEILNNIGLLTMGSTVLPALLDKFNFLLAVLGLVAAVLFWYGSIITARKY